MSNSAPVQFDAITKFAVICTSLIFATIVGCCGFLVCLHGSMGDSRIAFNRLIAGNAQIESVIISGHGKQFTVNAPELTTYLRSAFKTAKDDGLGFEYLYEMKINLASGDSLECYVHVPANQDVLMVSEPLDSFGIVHPDPLTRYSITLAKPLPEELAELFSKLRSEVDN